MIYIETKSLDPTWNLAFEEYCLTELTQFPKIMLLWQNDNAIIVGRYQIAESEINVEAAKAIGAKVVRRSTGGGTVYHDMGNLNYSFILPAGDRPKRVDISEVSRPMVNALNALGAPAEVKGRNDLVIDGKKISGTAQRYTQGRLLHHGTLLFDSDLTMLQSVLNVDRAKFVSKGVASVKSRVTNIKPHLAQENHDLKTFWEALLAAFEADGKLERYEPTEDDLAKIRVLQETKYQAWDWSTGSAPAFEYSNSDRYTGGKLEVRLDVKRGIIEACQISGDFLGLVELDDLVNAIIGTKYQPDAVREVLGALNLSMFLGGITEDDVIQCMFKDTLLISEE